MARMAVGSSVDTLERIRAVPRRSHGVIQMPSEHPFRDIRKILESYGWTLHRINGSHHVFNKQGEEFHISLPVHHGKVKPGYIKKLEKKYGINFREA